MAYPCPTCRGERVVKPARVTFRDNWVILRDLLPQPCPDCTGGIYHCCEGERAQAEVKSDA